MDSTGLHYCEPNVNLLRGKLTALPRPSSCIQWSLLLRGGRGKGSGAEKGGEGRERGEGKRREGGRGGEGGKNP